MLRTSILILILLYNYVHAGDQTSLHNSLILQESHYGILHVHPKADANDIKKSYKKLALKQHPDKNPNNPQATEDFQRLQGAYDNLSDSALRNSYDLELAGELCNSHDHLEQDLGSELRIHVYKRRFKWIANLLNLFGDCCR